MSMITVAPWKEEKLTRHRDVVSSCLHALRAQQLVSHFFSLLTPYRGAASDFA
jgi:hypothetical protein